MCQRGGGDGDQDGRRTAQVSVCREVQDSGAPLYSGRIDAGQFGLEEKAQNASKARWRDVKVAEAKTCHGGCIFLWFGSKHWCWRQAVTGLKDGRRGGF